MKTLESTKLVKPEKSRVEIGSDGKNKVDDIKSDNEVGNNKVNEDKATKKKNY